MKALALHAGPAALAHIRAHGLVPSHVAAVPAAAGGPKGLMLLHLDRHLFGHWLPQAEGPIDLVGASIGAWRLATACLDDPVAGFDALEHHYIHDSYPLRRAWGRWRLPPPSAISASFAANLHEIFDGSVDRVLAHPRYRLHVMTSHGRSGLLAKEGPWRSTLGYLAAYVGNARRREALGQWLERVVFSTPVVSGGTGADTGGAESSPLPFDARDFPTRQVSLTPASFLPAVQASGSIPFVLEAVHDIPGAPRGAYWDGGITDYHLHLRYLQGLSAQPAGTGPARSIVLYPHFQRTLIPGWFDKAWTRRHASTAALDHVLLLSPRPDWVAHLPHGKLPDRQDFKRYLGDDAGRIRAWTQAVAASRQLADEWAHWLEHPDPGQVQPL